MADGTPLATINCHRCELCQETFPSKTKLFKHLVVHGFESKSLKPTKVVLLIGWLSNILEDNNEFINDQTWNCVIGDETSHFVEESLFRALYVVENKLSSLNDIPEGKEVERPKGFSRGGGCLQRTSALLGTEPTCHSLCDTYCFLIRPLGTTTMEIFVSNLNMHLPHSVRILHGYELSSESASGFQAETECTQRRYEYMVPLRIMMPIDFVSAPAERITRRSQYRSRQPTEADKNAFLMDFKFPIDTDEGQTRISYFRKLKEICRLLQGRHRYHNYTTGGATATADTTVRRVDRIYHKNLITYQNEPWVIFSVSGDTLLRGQVRRMLAVALAVALEWLPSSYLEASLSADNIIEVPALPGAGLYLAECRYANWEAHYRDNRLDPRRMGDSSGLEQDSPAIAQWTEKVHAHIARTTQNTVFGDHLLHSLRQQCSDMLKRHIAVKMLRDRTLDMLKVSFAEKFGIQNMDEVNALCKGHEEPVADSSEEMVEEEKGATAADSSVAIVTARGNKDDFARLQAQLSFVSVLPPFDDCPPVYREVLHYLRLADRSQSWPASSTGRQQVIANATLIETGGRGGSFSVGALPKHLPPPKGNDLFPELLKAAFRLERLLCPNRVPSTTIAINRHAQFLPHRDTGAGMGQSGSLIVGVGAYVGGETVVDQVAHDLRYNPLQFNGWKSIHYTLPFVGERYSLVWFTPLGLGPEDQWWWQEPDMQM
eukprot:gene1233-1345_t